MGPTGPTGPAGPAAATIPFFLSNAGGEGVQLSTDDQGAPMSINFSGFGAAAGYPVELEAGAWNAGIITINEYTYYPINFIMPVDGILRSLYVLFANREPLLLDAGVVMRPFACLAISDGVSLEYTVLRDTLTYAAPYVGLGEEEEIPKYSLRRGALTNLNIQIPEGTVVGIVIGWIGEGVTSEQYAYFSASGGLFLE